MAVIADRCPHVRVTVVDINAARIAAWNSDRAADLRTGPRRRRRTGARPQPVLLDRRRRRHPCGRHHLRLGEHADEDVRRGRRTGRRPPVLGEDRARDPGQLRRAARSSSRSRRLPVRTAAAMARILNSNGKGLRVPGAVESRVPRRRHAPSRDLEHPDRVLIGSRGDRRRASRPGRRSSTSTPAGCRASASSSRTSGARSCRSSPPTPSSRSAFRRSTASRRSARRPRPTSTKWPMRLAPTRASAPKFLKASVGFGGSCFKKDILNLVYICRELRPRGSRALLGVGGPAERVAAVALRPHHAGQHVQHRRRQAHRAVRIRLQGRHRRHARVAGAGRDQRTCSTSAPTSSSPIRRRCRTPVWISRA